MLVENTRNVITRYFEAAANDTSMLADDVVFTIMGTGESQTGPDAVMEMQRQFYKVALTAKANRTNLIVGEHGAVLEAQVIGTHTGEFAGIPATGKEIDVPLCVVYDVEGDTITRGRIYFELSVFMEQIGIGD